MDENNEVKITLEQLIDLTNKFITGEISQELMSEFGAEMSVRTYIPIQEKIDIIMALLLIYKYPSITSQEIRIAELYKNIFYYIVLNGYAMVDCSKTLLLTLDNYDLLFPIFYPFILNYCKDDYKVIMGMLHDTINMYSIMDIESISSSIDEDKLSKAAADGKYILDRLEKDNKEIQDLKDLVNMDNPEIAKVLATIKESSLNK